METIAMPEVGKPLIITQDRDRGYQRPHLDETILSEVNSNGRAIQNQLSNAALTDLAAAKDAQYQCAATVERAVNNLTAQNTGLSDKFACQVSALNESLCMARQQISDASTTAQIGLRDVESRLLARVQDLRILSRGFYASSFTFAMPLVLLWE